jgi:hypothetical protein
MKTLKFVIILLSTTLLLISCNKEVILEGDWLAESYQSHPDSAKIYTLNEYLLRLDVKKQFSFYLDVNLCGGEILFNKNKSVIVSEGMCTFACCDTEFPTFIINKLSKANKYEIKDNYLIFSNDSPFVKINFKKK